MKLADSELTDKETEVQSNWNRKKPPKTYIPDDSFVSITEPITDIKSLLELYGDGGNCGGPPPPPQQQHML